MSRNGFFYYRVLLCCNFYYSGLIHRFSRYYFWDDGNGLLGHKNVTMTLSWNVIPNAGNLPRWKKKLSKWHYYYQFVSFWASRLLLRGTDLEVISSVLWLFEEWCKCTGTGTFKNNVMFAPWRSLTKRTGSGSVSQRYGSGSVPKCLGSGAPVFFHSFFFFVINDRSSFLD